MPYLQMSGVGSYIKTPLITFDSIIIDMFVEHQPGVGAYYFDARTGATGYVYRETNNTERWNGNISQVLVNDVAGTWNTAFVPDKTRFIFKTIKNTLSTDDVNIFSNNVNTQNAKGNIYDIKFYNGTTLVAHYDMSKGNVQDQTGNGYHATLVGGTWVDDTPTGTDVLYTYATKQQLTADRLTPFTTAQKLYKNELQLIATKQIIFTDEIRTEVYATKQIIYTTKTDSHATKQAIYKDEQNALPLKQIIHATRANNYTTKQVIHANQVTTYQTKQRLYLDKLYTYPITIIMKDYGATPKQVINITARITRSVKNDAKIKRKLNYEVRL